MYSPFSHPDKVIARGSAILSTLAVAAFISSFATVDAAIRSGEVTEYVINPTKQAYTSFINEIEHQQQEDAAAEQRYLELKEATKPYSGKANVKTEINITTGTTTTTNGSTQSAPATPAPTPYPVIVNPPVTNSNSTFDDDWEARRAQQEAEFDELVKQRNEEYEERVKQNQEEYQKRYEESVAKQKADLEAWKKENGFD